MLNFLNKKFISSSSKTLWIQAFSNHPTKSILSLPHRNFAVNNKDRAAIYNSKNLVISQTKLYETGQENIRKNFEEIYNQFINSNQDFSQVWQTFKDISNTLPHLKLSKNTVHYQNQHLKFIIDKAIESLQHDFSYHHLNDFLRFCDFFKIDDPSLFDKITTIINQNPDTLSLEEKLKIMTEYNYVLPLLDNLPDANSLNFKEAVYLLYLGNVKNQFEESSLREIQEKVINSIDNNFKTPSSNISFMLLVTLIHLNSTIGGGLEDKIAHVTRILEQSASQLPAKKLIKLFTKLHDPQLKDEKLLLQITKLIDQKIPEMNFHDIGTLILSMHELAENSDYPPFIQKANQTLVKSLTVNILPDKSRNLNIGHPLLTALLNLHELWGVWDPNMSEIFSNLITALFDVKRIKADTYLKLVSTITKLDQGKVSDLCLSVLQFKIKDIIADANLQSLTNLYENIKQYKDIARQYEIYLTSKISDSIKLPNSVAINENVFLHIVKNMDSFSTEFIQDYSKKVQESIETSPIHFVLNLHSILLNNITLESLKENKSQPLLYVLEKKVAALVEQFDFISSKNYLRSLGNFAVKIEQLKNKSYQVNLIDINNFKITKNQQEVLIPLNLTLLQNRLISELETTQTDPNRLTELGRTLLILETFNSQKSLQNYDSILQTIWQNLQQGQLSLLSFANILRSSSNLRDRFKSNLIDKDPEILEKLTTALFQELDKFSSSLPAGNNTLENQPKEDLKSHHYHIFVMTNMLLSWKVTNDQLAPKLKEFIASRIDDFTLDDLIAVISFGSNIFANERKELYAQVLPRLGWLILNKKLAHHQAFELLMSLHLNTLDEKTFFELEKNIAANFLQFKVQDIMKLIAKFKRYNIKSTKILWNVVRFYFRPEYIINMTPTQVSVFSDILISEKYGDIIPSIEHYLIKHENSISRDTNLAKLLFLTANFSKKTLSKDFVNLWTKNFEFLSIITNPQVLVYLLGTLPVFKKTFEGSAITINEENLADKWRDLLQKATLTDLMQISAAIEYVNDNSQGISYPWVPEKLLQETAKRAQITIDTVNIFSSLYHEKSLLPNFSQSLSQCIPTFVNQAKDFDSISKFTLAWQRSLTGVPNLEHTQMIRKKILFANPNLLTSIKPIINLLTTVAEMEKKIENTTKDYFFTKKDYKLLNRIEDTILMRVLIFKEDDLNLLYRTYVDTQLGSTRILSFLEKRLFK